MKTKTITLLAARLALLVTLGSTHSFAGKPPKDPPEAKDPPILFVAPGDVWGISTDQILSIDADGTGLRQLTRGSTPASLPSYSPDYRHIAFMRGGWITVMEAKGEPRTRALRVCRSWTGPGHDWSPDGLSIVFCGSSDLEANGLWRVPVNPDTGAVGTPELLKAGHYFGPTWSPDGTKIAFHLNGVVGVLDLETGEETSFDCWSSIYPTWNPTADRLAFAGVVNYENPDAGWGYYEICTANADLTGVTPVTSLKSSTKYQTWSPDGRRLVIQSNVNGSTSLYLTEIGSSTVTLLYEGGSRPSWAP